MNTETQTHENVRERLNNLLHKKISNQQQQSQEGEENAKTETYQSASDNMNEPIVEITENCEDESTNVPEEDFNQLLLHHILNEKKKALLRDKDVMHFLQTKMKWNEAN